jgi:hypothetical protein
MEKMIKMKTWTHNKETAPLTCNQTIIFSSRLLATILFYVCGTQKSIYRLVMDKYYSLAEKERNIPYM